jgi:hypothetical protein
MEKEVAAEGGKENSAASVLWRLAAGAGVLLAGLGVVFVVRAERPALMIKLMTTSSVSRKPPYGTGCGRTAVQDHYGRCSGGGSSQETVAQP